ncbi:hypothetical protein HZA39_03130 [Candidatus Peregrinibacteria bacterium]|nr:hypothetical protein [Candidatus Peregrinibacteria bacterium]
METPMIQNTPTGETRPSFGYRLRMLFRLKNIVILIVFAAAAAGIWYYFLGGKGALYKGAFLPSQMETIPTLPQEPMKVEPEPTLPQEPIKVEPEPISVKETPVTEYQPSLGFIPPEEKTGVPKKELPEAPAELQIPKIEEPVIISEKTPVTEEETGQLIAVGGEPTGVDCKAEMTALRKLIEAKNKEEAQAKYDKTPCEIPQYVEDAYQALISSKTDGTTSAICLSYVPAKLEKIKESFDAAPTADKITSFERELHGYFSECSDYKTFESYLLKMKAVLDQLKAQEKSGGSGTGTSAGSSIDLGINIDNVCQKNTETLAGLIDLVKTDPKQVNIDNAKNLYKNIANLCPSMPKDIEAYMSSLLKATGTPVIEGSGGTPIIGGGADAGGGAGGGELIGLGEVEKESIYQEGKKLPAWGEEGEWGTGVEQPTEACQAPAKTNGMLKDLSASALSGAKTSASTAKKSAATGPETLLYLIFMAGSYGAARFIKRKK